MRGSELFHTIASENPFKHLHPKTGEFFKRYLEHEKAVDFNGRKVINTHFPPFPSPSFDNMVKHIANIGSSQERSLYSVTLAVTNRCGYKCWHCYNAGRTLCDLPTDTILETVDKLDELNVVKVTLTGGEPLLRADLETIADRFGDKTTLVLNTTGFGLTEKRASALRESGVFATGISLDSINPEEHDRMRGKQGAFDTAVTAVGIARDAGLYPYVISVATREFLDEKRFYEFLHFAADIGARELHLLEPCATGELAGLDEVTLDNNEKQHIIDYQKEYAARDDMPVVSSFLYLESAEAFGCGAGLTHLYIDGSGEVSPCNLLPLSFGNLRENDLESILGEMGKYFDSPRTECVAQELARHIPPGSRFPLSPSESKTFCNRHLPAEHEIPAFFRAKQEAAKAVGGEELKAAYDTVHDSYDEFWVTEAGKPVEDLVDTLDLAGDERIFEAGCGTGHATQLLSRNLDGGSSIDAVDLSEGMLSVARGRFAASDHPQPNFISGDALELLDAEKRYDLVFSSWVLGYIPIEPFIEKCVTSLSDGGRLAFIVHRENSPARELAIFEELISNDPGALTKPVDFDFPRDSRHVGDLLARAGLITHHLSEGEVTFRYDSADEVLEHLLKSGAGTAFYQAIDPAKRDRLARSFVERLKRLNNGKEKYEVIHEYVACIGTWYE